MVTCPCCAESSMADMNSQALVVSDLVIHARRVSSRVCHFRFARGGSLGIVGELAVGKSTILKAIAGINHDWDGDIEVMGRRLGNQRKLVEQRSLQMVIPGDPLAALNPAHTVDEALREPLIVHGIADHQTRVMHALADGWLAGIGAFPLSGTALRRAASACVYCPRVDGATRCLAAGRADLGA